MAFQWRVYYGVSKSSRSYYLSCSSSLAAASGVDNVYSRLTYPSHCVGIGGLGRMFVMSLNWIPAGRANTLTSVDQLVQE